MPTTVLWPTLAGPHGLSLLRLSVPAGATGRRAVRVGPGTPSILAASLEGGDVVLIDPVGRRRSGRALVVVDPAEGTWQLEAEQGVEATLVATAWEEPEHALRALPDAAGAGGGGHRTGGASAALWPAACALAPLCGARIDVDDATHAAPVVAASDLTGVHPDDVADAVADLPPGTAPDGVLAVLRDLSGL